MQMGLFIADIFITMAPSDKFVFLFLGPRAIYDYSCLMGPCGLFRINRSICTWAFPCASLIYCDIMCQDIIRLITDAEDDVKDTIIQEVFMKQDF